MNDQDFNPKLPYKVLHRLKERKLKLRKFMLYVNSVLNETEQDMMQICQSYEHLGNILYSHGYLQDTEEYEYTTRPHKIQKKTVDFVPCPSRITSTNLNERNEDVVVPETAPYPGLGVISPEYPETMTVHETNADETNFMSPCANQTMREESFFLPSRADQIEGKSFNEQKMKQEARHDTKHVVNDKTSPTADFCKPRVSARQHKIHHTKCRKPNETTDMRTPSVYDNTDDIERSESSFLSPVSSLVNSVLSSKNISDKMSDEPNLDKTIPQVLNQTLHDNPAAKKNCPLKERKTQNAEDRSISKEAASSDKVNDVISIKESIHTPKHGPLLAGKQLRTPVDLTVSPALFDEEEDFQVELMVVEGEANESDDDITQLDDASLDNTDIVITKAAKNPAKWPIGYPKPVSKGELVVEPSSGKKSYKRVRQTRLDGYLNKASNQTSQTRRSMISLTKGQSQTRSISNTSRNKSYTGNTEEDINTTKCVEDSLHSDSDDALDGLDLELLNTEAVRRPNISRMSTSRNASASNDTLISRASTSRGDRDREDGATQDSFPRKKPKLQDNDVVRGRARKNLTGFRCIQCYEYYKTLNMGDEEIQHRINEVCRHRAVKPPMQTPPSFWNMSIMSNLDPNESSI